MRIIPLAAFVLLLISLSQACSGEKENKPVGPNVIIINTDDLGYGDLGCYGASKVSTPNIDRLASHGRLFTDAHSTSAICSPSRYALLTGQYAFRKNGLYSPIFLRHPLVIDTTRLTLASMFRQEGYATACIGKWHLGFGTETPVDWNKPLKPGPLELGFDYYFGLPVVNSHPPFVFVENHHIVGYDPSDPLVYGERAKTKPFREKFGYGEIGGAKKAHALYDDEQLGTVLKNKAVEWINQNYSNPFFLYFATSNIHHPFTSAPQFHGTSEAGVYGDFIHELDWIVGEVVNALDELNIAKNTLLIFTSDNGGMLNKGGQEAWIAGHHLNGDLLGFKFDAWEGGHRIPFIVCWPGMVEPGSQSDILISNIDMMATLAAIIGRPLQADEGPDSYNVLEAFIDNPAAEIRDHLIVSPEKKQNIALREGKWMYISAQGGGGSIAPNIGDHGLGGPAAHLFTKHVNSDIENGKIKKEAPPAQLYDLSLDPYQTRNLYNEFPEVVLKLKSRLAELMLTEHTAIHNKNQYSLK